MITFFRNESIHKFLLVLMLLTAFMSNYAQAALVSTYNMINTGEQQYTQEQLQTALASQELKRQLEVLGVDTAQLNDRIASLTPGEIQQLNAELEQQAAGGILGVLLTVFIVFVITDMLCATDLFTFVKCINK